MKGIKFWMGAFFVALLVTMATVSINLPLGTPGDNDLYLTNIEALAQTEQGDSGCEGTGNLLCSNGSYYKTRITQ